MSVGLYKTKMIVICIFNAILFTSLFYIFVIVIIALNGNYGICTQESFVILCISEALITIALLFLPFNFYYKVYETKYRIELEKYYKDTYTDQNRQRILFDGNVQLDSGNVPVFNYRDITKAFRILTGILSIFMVIISVYMFISLDKIVNYQQKLNGQFCSGDYIYVVNSVDGMMISYGVYSIFTLTEKF